MKFNLFTLALIAISSAASTGIDEPRATDFAALKAETESMKSQFLRESKAIDDKLQAIVKRHTPSKSSSSSPSSSSSLVQLQSMEQLERNRHEFEEESNTLLETNKAKVEKYKARFEELLAKLREDVSDKNYGSSSFLEVEQKNSGLDVDQLFEQAKAKVEKLHFVTRDIRNLAKEWKQGVQVPSSAGVVTKDEASSFDSIEV